MLCENCTHDYSQGFIYTVIDIQLINKTLKILSRIYFRKLIEQKSTKIYEVEGWLKLAAKYLWRTSYRDKNKHKDILEDYSHTLSRSAHNDINLDINKISELMEQTLTPRNAQIIHLSARGFKNPEIAAKMGLSEKQVRQGKYEARLKLKKLIGNENF